ncbi:signal peptidase II [Sporanaerobacter acetigenes DSM 13106]|uniref:Lipoprotein signal peptidase n=1 Tax=Sporanaerobacter acetigenes DSM 13106 TaxID=1123281 RepID=A0A1M5XWP4_9FIRM|nr:signal peptidase II [Sporanaerobacter acetigenes DSM 13106]
MLYGIFILIILLDQFTKQVAVKYLKLGEPLILIENFLSFTYVENRGAAFGILQNKKIFFLIITVAVIFFVVFFLKKNFYHLSKLMKVSLVMLIAGAVGNLIDRIRLGYVIDFISVRFSNGYYFPVFNVADSFIVISTILIVIMVLFNKYEV